MSQQYNKVIKRRRLEAYLKRKKHAAKAKKAAPPAAKPVAETKAPAAAPAPAQA